MRWLLPMLRKTRDATGFSAGDAVWFAEQDGTIARTTMAGAISTVRVPTANSQPDGITAGPGKTLWFTEMGADRIGRIDL